MIETFSTRRTCPELLILEMPIPKGLDPLMRKYNYFKTANNRSRSMSKKLEAIAGAAVSCAIASILVIKQDISSCVISRIMDV